MRLDKDKSSETDLEPDDRDPEAAEKHRKVQRLIEERLERQRLEEDLKDIDDDWEDMFEWDNQSKK